MHVFYTLLKEKNAFLTRIEKNVFYDTYKIDKGVLILDKETKDVMICTHVSVSIDSFIESELIHIVCNNLFCWIKYKSNYELIL